MKYHVSLRFQERPDLHMTLQHYSRVRNQEVLKEQIIEKVRTASPQSFIVTLDQEGWLGMRHDIRVLQPSSEVPSWIYKFTKRYWTPHVTCNDESLTLTVVAIALMQRREEIIRWELT